MKYIINIIKNKGITSFVSISNTPMTDVQMYFQSLTQGGAIAPSRTVSTFGSKSLTGRVQRFCIQRAEPHHIHGYLSWMK